MERKAKAPKAAKAPAEVKEFRAQLGIALRKRGVSLDVLVEACDETDFPVARTTLFRHVQRLEADEPVISPDYAEGRPRLLTDEQWLVVGGAILCAEERTHLVWVRDWVRRYLGVELSVPTVSRHLKELSITAQSIVSRSLKHNMDRGTYVRLFYNDVLELHKRGFFTDMSKVVLHDSTSNSRRLERYTTLNISGGKARKLSAVELTYTDLYMAAIWGDGINRTPCLFFTYDKTFQRDGERWNEVLEWCRAWGIDPVRIVFLEKPQAKSVYVGAKKDHVGKFFTAYRKVLKDAKVIHDAGREYKKDGEYILADGAADHFVLRPETHGEVSPLDNRYFGFVKRWWRLEREKFCGHDVSKQNLYLLYCIDYVSEEQTQAQFTRNFLLDKPKLSLQAVEDMLSESTRLTMRNQAKETAYLDAYDKFVSGGGLEVNDALEDDLDGDYWK